VRAGINAGISAGIQSFVFLTLVKFLINTCCITVTLALIYLHGAANAGLLGDRNGQFKSAVTLASW
jgi:hypothetical protein